MNSIQSSPLSLPMQLQQVIALRRRCVTLRCLASRSHTSLSCDVRLGSALPERSVSPRAALASPTRGRARVASCGSPLLMFKKSKAHRERRSWEKKGDESRATCTRCAEFFFLFSLLHLLRVRASHISGPSLSRVSNLSAALPHCCASTVRIIVPL